jgi:hypothetical protein
MRLINICFWLIILMLSGYACDELSNRHSNEAGRAFKIPVPIPSIEPADSIFYFLAEDGFEYEFSNGTSISIPGRAFIRPDGSLVNGEVTVQLTFYKDALDLFLDAYLMDNKGEVQETAGGFHIQALQNGQALVLDPSRQIKVRLACYSKERGFALYQYNNQLDTWDSLQSVKQEINEARIIIERRHRRNLPQIRFPLNEQYFALSYQSVLDILYSGNYTNINHQRTQNRMEAYGLRWTKLKVKDQIVFEDQLIAAEAMIWKNISRKPFPEWTKNKKGSLEPVGVQRYRLLIKDKGKSFSTQVEAIMPMEDLFSLGPGYWKKDYEAKLASVDRVDQLIQMMPQSYRSFGIYELGTYIWQKPKTIDSDLLVQIQFKAPLSKLLSVEGFYWLSEDQSSLVHFSAEAWDSIPLAADNQGRLFSVAAGRRIINIPKQQIQTLDYEQLRKMQTPAILLKGEELNKLPYNKKQFLEMLY